MKSTSSSAKPSSGGMHSGAKKNYETPAMLTMTKMATALGKKMGIPNAHDGSGGGQHTPEKNHETPAMKGMVKMATALGKKMGIPNAHEGAAPHAGGEQHRPDKAQLMDFANQLRQLPCPGQGGGNLLKETLQYGKKVQALSQTLRTPPSENLATEKSANHGNEQQQEKQGSADNHSYQSMGQQAAAQRMQTIMKTMHAPEHPVHKVMDVLSDFTQGKMDKDGLREHISAIGAQLPKGAKQGARVGAGSFPEISSLKKQAQSFAEIGGLKNATSIISAHQEMSERIAEKLKEFEKTAPQVQGKK